MRQVAIAGAGLAGSLLAIFLAKRGYRVDVYERRRDIRGARIDFGRSINLALSERGAHALKQVDLLDKVMANGVPMRARAIHSPKGDITYQPFGRHDGEYLAAIERHTLNIVLLEATREYPSISVHFNQRLTGIDFSTMRLALCDQLSNEVYQRECQSLVAGDGVFSVVRRLMVEKGLAQFVEDELAYGYKELLIPEESGRDLRRECLHLWPRRSFSMIANPNPDRTFTCTLFLPHDGTPGFAQLKTQDDVRQFFTQYFPDAYERMPGLIEDFFGHPIGVLPTVRGGPWYFEDKVLLLGDAAHALVPFFAQGMNSAFQDCELFAECLAEARDRWEEALPAFFNTRKADADAIGDMTMQNYREIQDYIADERFLLRKHVEQELMRRYPQLYTSMHVMVMFTRVPYAFAKACGALQETLLHSICKDLTRIDQVDWSQVEPLMARYADEVRRQSVLLRVDPRKMGLTLG